MRWLLLFVLSSGSCQLLESRDMQPIADAAEAKLVTDLDFAKGWRGVLERATKIDPAVRAAMFVKIDEFELRSKEFSTALLDFASKAGKVDWRALYQQVKGATR